MFHVNGVKVWFMGRNGYLAPQESLPIAFCYLYGRCSLIVSLRPPMFLRWGFLFDGRGDDGGISRLEWVWMN